MKTFWMTVTCLALWAAPATAETFEGVLHLDLSGDAKGKLKLSLGKGGARMELRMEPVDRPGMVELTVVRPAGSKNVSYLINDKQKTYAEMDSNAAQAHQPPEKKLTPKLIGPEKLQGYATQHALVTDADGNETEAWTTKELGSFDVLAAGGPGLSASEQMQAALKGVGAEGFPVRLIQRRKLPRATTMKMELQKAEPQVLPASTFELPKGYRKLTPLEQMMSAMPPEGQERMQRALKNMNPAQRKMIEEQMGRSKAPPLPPPMPGR